MRKKDSDVHARCRVLVLVDESNVGSSVRTAGRGLDWLKLRDFLAGPNSGRDLIEMVVYAGLPPAIPTWQDERDKKNKFVHWLRSNGFMVVTKDGAPAEEGRYKANVDVIDLAPLFRTFEMIRVQDATAPVSHRTQSASGGRRRRPRFRPVAASQQAVKS